MLQDTRQIEQVKGRLTFPAFAMTYSAGNQFQMNRAFVFALMRLSGWILATIRSVSYMRIEGLMVN